MIDRLDQSVTWVMALVFKILARLHLVIYAGSGEKHPCNAHGDQKKRLMNVEILMLLELFTNIHAGAALELLSKPPSIARYWVRLYGTDLQCECHA